MNIVDQLQKLQELRQSGAINEEEFAAVLQVYREARKITPAQLMIDLAKWVAPPIAVALSFIALYLWKGHA